MSRSWVLVLAGLAAIVVLQGCGGSATTSAPTTATTTTTTTTTTSTTSTTTTTTTKPWPRHIPRTPPLSADEIAKQLNAAYMDFDAANGTGQLGVTISMAANTTTFDSNMFCAAFMGTTCYHGQADCRMSASLYNHKMLLQGAQNTTIKVGLSRPVGYVFNQTKVESLLGKCAFVFDGASGNNYNNGCGRGAAGNCSIPTSAFSDICPSTDKICTANDTEVKSMLCQPYGPVATPKSGDATQCFFSLPSLDRAAHQPSPEHLRDMVKARIRVQDGPADPEKGPLIGQWNEVVIDEHLLLPALYFDPATVITAFVYVKSVPEAKAAAEGMRDEFGKSYDVKGIPVIAIDDKADFTKTDGPFVLEKAEQFVV